MSSYYPNSKVEVKGFEAKHYDRLLDIITFGSYASFIKKAIEKLEIKPNDRILDLGAGTGRNACLMRKFLSEKGEIVGLDISDEMIAQFKKKCEPFNNVKIIKKRIDEQLDYKDEFDKAFISFVLHGFPQEVRIKIIRNVFNALKKQGEFFILDYNEFSLDKMPFYLKIPFRIIECPYAFDFIEKDWKKILSQEGFINFKEYLFFGRYIRLLKGIKA
ncbi:MAG: methyltransferase domain-containing protein [Caldisericaceae bacterium]